MCMLSVMPLKCSVVFCLYLDVDVLVTAHINATSDKLLGLYINKILQCYFAVLNELCISDFDTVVNIL